MTINAYQSNHYFENRLYISPLAKPEIQNIIHSEKGEEYKGAGIRSYSYFFGRLLSFFGISFKLIIGSEDFYLNKKSFSKLIIRQTELEGVRSPQETAKKLNELFISHKTTGYDEKIVKILINRLMQILKENEIQDISQIIKHLRMASLDKKLD